MPSIRRPSARRLAARIIILEGHSPSRALAAHQLGIDGDDVEPCLGQPAREILATGPEAHHDDVDLLTHWAPPSVTWVRAYRHRRPTKTAH